MAKGDHERGERRIDEQMKQSQSYLTALQQQLGNQYGAFNNMFWGGGGAPQQGNIYGWGTTVPHYSPYGPIFSGNNTDRPVSLPGGKVGDTSVPRRNPIDRAYMLDNNIKSAGSGRTQDAASYYKNFENQFNQLFPGQNVSSEDLIRNEAALRDMGMEVQRNASGRAGKVKLPNGDIIDVVGGGESGANVKQWLYGPGSPMSTGGGINDVIQTPGGGGVSGIIGRNMGDYNDIFSRFSGFADTGGFSEADKANIRARAISPIRSIYSSARQGLDRQRALQGGYSPGYATALGRFSREQGQLTSDATTNAEAAIAEMVQRGKLAGMSGMLSAYGATPGLSNMFGNQMLTSMGQQLQGAGLQNQLSLGLIGGQQNLASVPGDVGGFFNGLGNFSRNMSGAIYPWLGGSNLFGGGPGSGRPGPAGRMPSPYGYG